MTKDNHETLILVSVQRPCNSEHMALQLSVQDSPSFLLLFLQSGMHAGIVAGVPTCRRRMFACYLTCGESTTRLLRLMCRALLRSSKRFVAAELLITSAERGILHENTAKHSHVSHMPLRGRNCQTHVVHNHIRPVQAMPRELFRECDF